MSSPNDILLPNDAKYISFVDPKLSFNPHFDIIWSFQIALTGTEHAFSTFLATSSLYTPELGHYLGLPIEVNALTTEFSIPITTEYNDYIVLDQGILPTALISISFDTTGFNALSTSFRPGLKTSEIKRNSLTIRDEDQEVIYHEALSALTSSETNTTFSMSSSQKYWQTLRFRLSNLGSKLYIDLKTNDNYETILTYPVNVGVVNEKTIYAGFTFTAPVSSIVSPDSTLFLNNFHIQGNTTKPTYEVVENIPFSIEEDTYKVFETDFIIKPTE